MTRGRRGQKVARAAKGGEADGSVAAGPVPGGPPRRALPCRGPASGRLPASSACARVGTAFGGSRRGDCRLPRCGASGGRLRRVPGPRARPGRAGSRFRGRRRGPGIPVSRRRTHAGRGSGVGVRVGVGVGSPSSAPRPPWPASVLRPSCARAGAVSPGRDPCHRHKGSGGVSGHRRSEPWAGPRSDPAAPPFVPLSGVGGARPGRV